MKVKTLVWIFIAIISLPVVLFFSIVDCHPSIQFAVNIVFCLALGSFVLSAIMITSNYKELKIKTWVVFFIVIISWLVIMLNVAVTFLSSLKHLKNFDLQITIYILALWSFILSLQKIKHDRANREKSLSPSTSNPQEKL